MICNLIRYSLRKILKKRPTSPPQQGQLDEAAGIKPPGVELCVSSEPRKFGRFTMRDGKATAAKEAASTSTAAAATATATAGTGPQAHRAQLGERHLTRPQLRFARPPDNTPEPFRPKLTSKPHAKLPLKSEPRRSKNSAKRRNIVSCWLTDTVEPRFTAALSSGQGDFWHYIEVLLL